MVSTEEKIGMIKAAIEKADKMESPHGHLTYDVPALTSLKIRHLLNNIGALGRNYLECGVHRGGTFTASIRGNSNLEFITAVDSFESDHMNGEGARVDFLNNSQLHKPDKCELKLVISDSFELDISDIPKNVDIYLYDGDHSETAQKKALTYYIDAMADEFIYLCDDYDWSEVQKGTQDGIRECQLEKLFEKHLQSDISRPDGGHDNNSYWNGFYIALLKKKSE